MSNIDLLKNLYFYEFMGNTFGTLFKISSWGESHGGGIGVVIDGCPPRLPLDVSDIQKELDRRRPGQSNITTPRKESDKAEIVSGVYNGLTLGTPIAIYIPNGDHRPEAYKEMKDKFRPSHADFTYQNKYGIRNHEGGGRSSARETISRVAAGAIAKKILLKSHKAEIRAYVKRVYDIEAPNIDRFPTLASVEKNAIRCPDTKTAEKMIELIKKVRSKGDSVGGVIECKVKNLPIGLGSPVFDRVEADLAKGMLSLPATKGFELGSGFDGTKLLGSQHNDIFIEKGSKIGTVTNNSGGTQGGITNGEELIFQVAFKPTATILQKQKTVTKKGKKTDLMGRGRHDPCVLPRAVPIVESMASLILVDHLMRHNAQCESFKF